MKAEKTSAWGANRDAGSLPWTVRTFSMTSSKTQLACWTPFVSSSSPGTPQVRCTAASCKKHWANVDTKEITSTKFGFSYAPGVIGSQSIYKIDLQQPLPPMRHTSVSKSPTVAPSKYANSSTKPRSAQGRRSADFPVPKVARLRENPAAMKRGILSLLRH